MLSAYFYKRKKFFGIALTVLVLVFSLFFESTVLADQKSVQIIPNPIASVISEGSPRGIGLLLGKIIKVALGVVGVASLIVFMAGGIILLTSGGASDKIEKAKGIITGGILGIALIFSAYLIVTFVIRALGIAK